MVEHIKSGWPFLSVYCQEVFVYMGEVKKSVELQFSKLVNENSA